MISLAWRLAVRSGRDGIARAVFIAAGVALGVVLLLTALASYHALRAQDSRTGWLSTSSHNRIPNTYESSTDPLLWRRSADDFRGQLIDRVDVAATGPQSPAVPGIPAVPAPGQFYASPALVRLLAVTPADELGDRFPGHLVGTIGHAALASPHQLVVVVGVGAQQLQGAAGVVSVRSIESAPTQHSLTTFQEVAVGVGAAGLLFPILTFVGMATRIAAARREQRLAAMRLVGATVRQTAIIASVEAAVAAFAGTLAGVGAFYLARPYVARLRITGDSWYGGDLSLSVPIILLTCVAVPTAAAVAAVVALRRVNASPLGVARRATPAPPRRGRLIPLCAGLVILGTFALAGRTYSRGASGSYAPTVVLGFLLVMAGIVVAGPWLTLACTRLLANRSTRPAGLIASRRLADNPAAAFRAVSGLILAVFVGSVFAAGTATASNSTALGDDVGAATTAIARPLQAPIPATTATPIAVSLRAVTGVRAVTLVRAYPQDDVNGFPQGLIACAELAGTPELGSCRPTAAVAQMPLYSLDAGHTEPRTVWPPPASASNDARAMAVLPVAAVVVATDGSVDSLERVRTTMRVRAPNQFSVPQTVRQASAATLRDITSLQHLAYLAIALSLLIAGCSQAVAVAGSLIERRRPFALLRLSGMTLGSLRRVVLLEAAIPLLGLAVVSAVGGLLTSELLLRALRGSTVQLPGIGYVVTILAGLGLALVMVAATMPLLRRISAPESARSE